MIYSALALIKHAIEPLDHPEVKAQTSEVPSALSLSISALERSFREWLHQLVSSGRHGKTIIKS